MEPAEKHMRRALELAERGRGYVEPNPLVGAVLVRDGVVVGEGWHERFGGPHAEVNALAHAEEQARGATLYVTLEPCCHHGKTPPCTDAVLSAGVARVVAAMADPFPQVAGQGAERLRGAGVPVEMGLCEAEARRLNAPYLKLLATARPYVHAKWAMSLDGKIATRTGDSKWISNETSRRKAHELRGRMDAIIVGIGTALADDPLLTARPPGPRTACRVVLDTKGRLPLGGQLARTARQMPTLIVTGERAPEEAVKRLTDAGCEVLRLSEAETGRIDVNALLARLGERRRTNVMVEGGGQILGAFRDANAIDEVHVFIAPVLLGGDRSAMAGAGAERVAAGMRFTETRIEQLDDDLYVHGYFK